jgi:alpha-glucosidase
VYVLAVGVMLLGGIAGRVFARPAPQRVTGPLTVVSPNGALVVTLGIDGQLTWSVALRGGQILRPSRIAMTLDGGRILGEKPVVSGTAVRAADTTLKPVVRIKRAEIRDHYNERRVDFAGGYAILVRAYDDGVAYRWVTTLPGDVTVVTEEATLAFAEDHLVYFPEETSLLSHQERQYKRLTLTEISPGRFSSLPAMVEMPGGVKVVITEADLFDYPGMDLTSGTEAHSLKGLFPAYPKKVELGLDRNERVVEREGYIARTRGTREFPWRVLAIAERDGDLLGTDIVYRLASETTMTDTSWIKPGKVAWDWWNDLNVYGVPFKSGVNTETYKHYIDFAAENGIEYIILDEGWYRLGDLLAISPDVDMAAIAEHATQKNVGLIMWVIWKTLDLQMGAALDQFEKWGVKGIKVDFMA